MSFHLSLQSLNLFYFSIPIFPLLPFRTPDLSALSAANPSPPVDVSFPVSPPCLPHNLPLSLLGCSEGRPCQCVVCQCGNRREHRAFHRSQNKDRHERNTSMFTLPDCTTDNLVCMRRSIEMYTTARPHTQTTNRYTTLSTNPAHCPSIRLRLSVTLCHCHTAHTSVASPQWDRLPLLRSTNMCSARYKVTHTHTACCRHSDRHSHTTGSHFQRDRMFFTLHCVKGNIQSLI